MPETLGELAQARSVIVELVHLRSAQKEGPEVLVKQRESTRCMKGKQIVLSMYLPPRKYWLLKSISQRSGYSMQVLLRRALDDVLRDAHRTQPLR